MTTDNIAIAAVISGTCWVALISRSISYAATRVIKRIDELEKVLKSR
jgi:hypothetical protein